MPPRAARRGLRAPQDPQQVLEFDVSTRSVNNCFSRVWLSLSSW
ncbi:hypothetical protein ACFV2B_06070 [Streptomyces lavendulae]